MLLPRLLTATVLAVALAACSGETAAPEAASVAAPAAAASVPTAPVSVAQPADPRLDVVPAAGTVTVRPGPFDDRFSLAGTRLAGGAVTTSLTVLSDVSDLIVLESQADFYDAAGALLGSARTAYEDEHAGSSVSGEVHTAAEAVPMRMPADPAYAARVHSAVLSVPVLVNE